MSHTQRLMRQTSTRHLVAAMGRHLHLGWLAGAAVYLTLLLVSRLLGVIPDWFTPLSLAAIPAVAVLAALVMMRRPAARDVARLIDARTGSKELFLTAAMIGDAPGEFRPIVVEQAEERAGQLKPAQVVPFRWQRGARDIAAALALLLVGVLFLPQLDPFKKTAERNKVAQLEEKLRETKKATALRSEQLAAEAGRQSEQVQLALQALEKTFREAKPLDREGNLRRLGEDQKQLGEMWRKVSNEMKPLDKTQQSFGATDPKKLEQWREELKKGDVTALKKEISDIREAVKKMEEMPAGAEKRAAQEALAQRLNEMAQAMKQEMNSPQASAALQRAMEQLGMSKLGEMSKEATQSALDSLQLSEEELQQLAQAMKDGSALEEALKNCQMAKQLADQQKLDGGECKNCNGQGDYAKLFAAKMGAGGRPSLLAMLHENSGMGPGIGNGSRRPEDDSTKSDFKTEKSSSQLTGGKLLLEWKTKEVGETGARAEEFREGVKRVKQGVSEAIQQEQVPPGYHEAIKKYFDSLPENAPAK